MPRMESAFWAERAAADIIIAARITINFFIVIELKWYFAKRLKYYPFGRIFAKLERFCKFVNYSS